MDELARVDTKDNMGSDMMTTNIQNSSEKTCQRNIIINASTKLSDSLADQYKVFKEGVDRNPEIPDLRGGEVSNQVGPINCQGAGHFRPGGFHLHPQCVESYLSVSLRSKRHRNFHLHFSRGRLQTPLLFPLLLLY